MRGPVWIFVTVLTVLLGSLDSGACADATSGNDGSTTLGLGSHEPELLPKEQASKNLLVRELLRQAILIAARDELGSSTRDAALRETIESGPTGTVESIDVQTLDCPDKFVRLKVLRTVGGEQKILLEKEVALPLLANGSFDYLKLVVAAEELSRNELVELLRQAGFKGKANARSSEVAIDMATRDELSKMNMFSQFQVLRTLHALQRDKGESAETLAALARAYANLGQLTRFHWNAAHKVFRARSLLYAQRLVQLESQSPLSLRNRAYAAALAGMHLVALEDLAAARKADPKEGNPPPTWEPVIEAYCRYDSKAIAAEPPPEVRELTVVMRYLILEDSDSSFLALTAGKQALDVVPECYAVCDSMARYPGVSNRHLVTVQGPLVLLKTLPERLATMEGLPMLVSESLKLKYDATTIRQSDPAWAAGASRQNIVKALVSSGTADKDREEPSWQALGRLLEDVTFVHVMRRMQFFSEGLGLPLESYQEQLRNAIEPISEHPYAAMVECMPLNVQRDAARIQELCINLKVVDAELPVYTFASRFLRGPERKPSVGLDIMRNIHLHADEIVQDLDLLSIYVPDPAFGHRLLAISPHSPQAIARLVARDLKYAQPRMPEWEQEYGDNAVVLQSLANRYLQLGQAADARRCLERLLTLTPDQEGFLKLAILYQQEKQFDRMKETLEESLKHEDFALAHARARVMLAQHYMESKQWVRAKPYADDAAKTGASWALQCAATCYEGLENWETAEELRKVNAMRYVSDRMDWYFWCQRTGHGNLNAAQTLASKHAAQLAQSPNPVDAEYVGVFYLLSHNVPLAQKAFRKSFAQTSNPYDGIHLALAAADAGDEKARDEALAETIDRGSRFRTPKGNLDEHNVSLAKWLNSAYHQPAAAALDLEALNTLLELSGPQEHANTYYFIGRYLKQRGDLEKASQYLHRCIETSERTKWNFVLASALLRELPAEKLLEKDDSK